MAFIPQPRVDTGIQLGETCLGRLLRRRWGPGKRKRIQQRLKAVQRWSATEIELLTATETKLSAAIVAALLSNRREGYGMDEEISETAKKSLADNARRKAFDRLERDGAQSTAALQRRVRTLADERNIRPADIHKLMYERPSTEAVLAFCKKQKLSFDWLLAGDLKGLKRMTQERQVAAASRETFKEKLARLSKSQREVVFQVVDQLLEGAS
jgi:hypothetical protein